MSPAIPIVPTKASRVRAAVAANPDLTVAELAKMIGMAKSEVRVALGHDPARRVKSVLK